MDEKLAKLIEIVCAEGEISPVELAERLDVSVRTVRSYVSRINEMLASASSADATSPAGRIEMRSSSVYRLEAADHDRLFALMGDTAADVAPGAAIPVTEEQRVTYLLSDLLYRTGWITIDDLAQILFVSRATVTEDLREVERRLGRFDLSVERRPRYGIRVVGQELKRRLCLAAVSAGGSIAAGAESPLVSHDALDAIDACVAEATKRNGFQINALARQNLLVHIAVAVSRIREGCYVPMEDEQLGRIVATREFSVARDVARLVASRFDISLPDEEVAYIAIHLSGRQTLVDTSAEESGLVISDEAWEVVQEMVEVVRRVFRFDFRGDLELLMNLARHVVPLAVRLRYHLKLENPILVEVKSRFSLAFSMALEASSVLAEKYGAVPSEDEVGYLALAFALALERQKTELPKKNILVVCATGAGSARLLEYRYRQEFGAYVDKIVTCDAAHVRHVDFTNIDYVFTTVPLAEKLPVPVREVGYFLEPDEVESVRALLTSRSRVDARSLFRRELYFDHLACTTREEALERLCARVASVEDVGPDFYELVARRERVASTAFGNRVAVPHPLEPASQRSFVAVALLDQPVRWGRQDVEVVLLLSLSEDAGDVPEGFQEALAELVLSAGAVDRLLADRGWETLMELLDSLRAGTNR